MIIFTHLVGLWKFSFYLDVIEMFINNFFPLQLKHMYILYKYGWYSWY